MLAITETFWLTPSQAQLLLSSPSSNRGGEAEHSCQEGHWTSGNYCERWGDNGHYLDFTYLLASMCSIHHTHSFQDSSSGRARRRLVHSFVRGVFKLKSNVKCTSQICCSVRRWRRCTYKRTSSLQKKATGERWWITTSGTCSILSTYLQVMLLKRTICFGEGG